MSLAQVQSRALLALQAAAVTVEAHLANGLPSFTLVGLAETEVKEARERVRSALLNAGLEFPANKRITVNLAPADLPKDSGRFDLPIALAILAASGQIDAAALHGWEFAGELSLSGALRPVRGALATALALCQQGSRARLVLPPGSAQEAAFVAALPVFCAHHLLDVVRRFAPGAQERNDGTGDAGWYRAHAEAHSADAHTADAPPPDLRDVRGQAQAKRALEIAAAGGHGVLLVGPPGTGKSMLAQRFAALLPPMSEAQALEAAAVASLAGCFAPQHWQQRRTAAPHHSASAVALVGGGSPPRPGEISLAHHGVLFLDELPEFPRAALEALREPLENGRITIARAARRSEFPARFQLLAAMNPCPCGYFGSALHACRCTPDHIRRYQGRISGPLLDRIDLHVEVAALAPAELLAAPAGEASAQVRARVQQAHARAMQRQGFANQQLHSKALDEHLHLQESAAAFAQQAALRLRWSARGTHRALKVARTIADLAGSERVEVVHIAEAMQYRRALHAQKDA